MRLSRQIAQLIIPTCVKFGQPIAGRVAVSRWLSTLKFLNTLHELIFLLVVNPDAFDPTLCYIVSINNHQEQEHDITTCGKTPRQMRWSCHISRIRGNPSVYLPIVDLPATCGL